MSERKEIEFREGMEKFIEACKKYHAVRKAFIFKNSITQQEYLKAIEEMDTATKIFDLHKAQFTYAGL